MPDGGLATVSCVSLINSSADLNKVDTFPLPPSLSQDRVRHRSIQDEAAARVAPDLLYYIGAGGLPTYIYNHIF